MKKLKRLPVKPGRLAVACGAAIGVAGLMLYKLGSLTGGLSLGEMVTAVTPVGWHGIYNQPLDLPLKLVRSLVFGLFPDHGQTLTRLPNAVFGALTIVTFTWLVRLWHGGRTALLAGLLFATSAWVLHVSRLASFDVLYLWIVPTLLLSGVLLKKYNGNWLVWYGNLTVWGLALYVPGLVWLIPVGVYFQRQQLAAAWRHFSKWWQRTLYVSLGLAWLPLLGAYLARSHNFAEWLGWPPNVAGVLGLVKQFLAVPVHLFIRGPEYPQLWLGQAPVLTAFSLVACVIGIYFYATRWRSARSRLLAAVFLAGWILVGLGGPVQLSLLVPLLYLAAATGIAYLLHEWMKIFPNNPLARAAGLGLISLAVALSCLYGLRAYFVAWPKNPVTKTVFQFRR